MRPKSSSAKKPAEQVVKDIRRATRRHFSAEDKIRIVLEGLRGDDSIAELCRKEGIAQSLYYTWSKEFMEAGKRRLAGDTARAATTDEVRDLRSIENMMGTVRRVCRNVKRRQNVDMALRWTAAGMMEAAKGFRRLKAHKQLPILKAALAAIKPSTPTNQTLRRTGKPHSIINRQRSEAVSSLKKEAP